MLDSQPLIFLGIHIAMAAVAPVDTEPAEWNNFARSLSHMLVEVVDIAVAVVVVAVVVAVAVCFNAGLNGNFTW